MHIQHYAYAKDANHAYKNARAALTAYTSDSPTEETGPKVALLLETQDRDAILVRDIEPGDGFLLRRLLDSFELTFITDVEFTVFDATDGMRTFTLNVGDVHAWLNDETDIVYYHGEWHLKRAQAHAYLKTYLTHGVCWLIDDRAGAEPLYAVCVDTDKLDQHYQNAAQMGPTDALRTYRYDLENGCARVREITIRQQVVTRFIPTLPTS